MPDHASVWRFRQTIGKLRLSAALLAEANRPLYPCGLVAKQGTLVDATLVAAAVRRPYEGNGVNSRDPRAGFAVKRGEAHFCYKAHSSFVRQAEMTSANVHDGRVAEALIQGDEDGPFADKTYDSHRPAKSPSSADDAEGELLDGKQLCVAFEVPLSTIQDADFVVRPYYRLAFKPAL